MTTRQKCLKSSFLHMAILCLSTLALSGLAGCNGVDWTSILDDLLNSDGDFTSSDLVGTWSGTITADSTALQFDFTVTSSGTFTAGDGATSGTAEITSAGKVTFSYVTTTGTGTVTTKLFGSMADDKDSIVMTSSSWSGASSGTGTFAGTLTKSTSSSTFLLTDLVGEWTGDLTESGTKTTYDFVIDSSGNLKQNDVTTGSASISSSGTVVFTVTSTDYTNTYEGTMAANKKSIAMTKHSWTGKSTGTASLSGTMY